MALTTCPECSREVSDQAVACPHCGYPLQAKRASTNPTIGDADTRILQTLQTQGKIPAIQLCRQLIPGIDLAQAKARVDAMEANLPVASRPRTGGTGCLLLAFALVALAARAFF